MSNQAGGQSLCINWRCVSNLKKYIFGILIKDCTKYVSPSQIYNVAGTSTFVCKNNFLSPFLTYLFGNNALQRHNFWFTNLRNKPQPRWNAFSDINMRFFKSFFDGWIRQKTRKVALQIFFLKNNESCQF